MAVLEKTTASQKEDVTVDALLNGLSKKARREVMLCLVREEILNCGGECQIQLTTDSGEWLGYVVPAIKADHHAKLIADYLTPERLARMERAAATPDSTIDAEEFLRRLDEEDRD